MENSIIDRNIILLIIFIIGFVSINWLLWIAWAREQVKKDLHKKDFAPIHVRWCPFGYWAWPYEIAFSTTFVDSTGCIQTARSSVHNFFFYVRWIPDDQTYLDRNMPLVGRLIYLLVAIGLIWFGIKHLWTGTLILPLKHTYSVPVHLHLNGWPLILLCSAGLSLAASFLLGIFYCYDRQSSREKIYSASARYFSVTSWILFWSSIVVYVIVDLQK